MQAGAILRPSVPGLRWRALILCVLLWASPAAALAQEDAEKGIRDRYGLGLTSGHTVDPVGDIDFLMVTGSALFDYEKVWCHPAPRDLRFK